MIDHVDVLIVGAGLSGVGAAVHLTKHCPSKTFTLLEGRDAVGGTWDLFRYPGIRSDSDMHTLGYSFKPWTEAKAIADGPSIRSYVNDTADEYGVREKIRFGHKVRRAAWDSASALWTIEAERVETGETVSLTANFLFLCGGYYSYDQGYTPDFPGRDAFKGEIVHPQYWPEDLDYGGKRVVVIGSGATAMTLVPAMTDKADKVTMLQRSPTYVVSRPAEDKAANFLRRILPDMWAYNIVRWRNVLMQQFFYKQTRTRPEKAKERLLGMTREALGEEMVEQHFTPRYNPWDQRLCLVPDGDLYDALNSGKADVATDQIETFTETGIKLKSGEELPADIVVTATGLQLEVWNKVQISVDGQDVAPRDTFAYKGLMYSGVPNMAAVFGYTNASWTLRADLISEYVCRLLNHMDEAGADYAVPELPEGGLEPRPWLDFSSGYVQRAMDYFPRQSTEEPWRVNQNYGKDVKVMRKSAIDDGVMRFGRRAETAAAADAPAVQVAAE